MWRENTKYIIHCRQWLSLVVSNLSEKAEPFNSHFASQRTSIVNNIKLPSLDFETSQRLENTTFTDDTISLIIKK